MPPLLVCFAFHVPPLNRAILQKIYGMRQIELLKNVKCSLYRHSNMHWASLVGFIEAWLGLPSVESRAMRGASGGFRHARSHATSVRASLSQI